MRTITIKVEVPTYEDEPIRPHVARALREYADALDNDTVGHYTHENFVASGPVYMAIDA